MENHGKQCNTECREDLLCKMSRKVDRGGVWKFCTIAMGALVFFWGVAYGIHAGGNAVMETIQKEQGTQIAKNTTAIATIAVQLSTLKEGQERLEATTQEILRELRKKGEK